MSSASNLFARHFGKIAFLVAAASAVLACGGSGDSTANPANGDEQDVKGVTCAPVTTLTCATGYETSTDGCGAGRAKCVKDPRGQTCGGIAGLKCPTGYDCVLSGKMPDAPGSCQKHVACVKAVCSDEENCDSTGGLWLDDDPGPDGLYCSCPKGKTWEDGKGCVVGAPVPTCLTLTCKSGFHCCSGPPTAPGSKPFAATCQPVGSFCPL